MESFYWKEGKERKLLLEKKKKRERRNNFQLLLKVSGQGIFFFVGKRMAGFLIVQIVSLVLIRKF